MNGILTHCFFTFLIGTSGVLCGAENRENGNEVKISSYGGACHMVWDWSRKMAEEGGIPSNKAANLEQALDALEKGADVKGPEGKRALMAAAALGRKEIVDFLLLQGAQSGGREGWNILLKEAVRGRSVSIAALVLQRGADADGAGGEGETPLMIAVRGNDGAMVNLLLEYGADASAVNQNGESAADGGERAGHPELEKILRSDMNAESVPHRPGK